MKKIMFLLAFAGISFGAFAQETANAEVPTLKDKVVTNGFWDNWFIDFGGDFISSYSSQEVGVSANPFSYERGNFGFDVSVGKWIVPTFGVRVKFDAAWARQVNRGENVYVGPISAWGDTRNPLFNQLNVSFQPMLNLNNLFAGYKPRVWNSILYGSVGYHRDFDHKSNSVLVGLGWLNTFNVTKRFHINLDIYADMGETDRDGNTVVTGRGFGARDCQVGVSVGCGFNLGKVGWDNAPDVDAIMAMNKAQLDALNASLADQQAENARLMDVIKNHKCPEPVVKVNQIVASKASVFFNIGKSRIASKKDLVSVKDLVDSAKANGKTIVVTGYADAKTGTAEYNQTLSEKRAKAVADELVKMGVSRDKIEIVAKGGVKDLEPISYNRRVVVSLK